jgi:hypothetical protein
MLNVGDTIQEFSTKYGPMGTFLIIKIIRDCTCTHYVDRINGSDNPLPKHVHITCLRPGGKKPCYINYISEDTLVSVSPYADDRYFVKCASAGFGGQQLELF